MSDINYFALTVADCEADYRNTMVGHVKTVAQELLDNAGAIRVRVGVVVTGDNTRWCTTGSRLREDRWIRKGIGCLLEFGSLYRIFCKRQSADQVEEFGADSPSSV